MCEREDRKGNWLLECRFGWEKECCAIKKYKLPQRKHDWTGKSIALMQRNIFDT